MIFQQTLIFSGKKIEKASTLRAVFPIQTQDEHDNNDDEKPHHQFH